MTAKEFLVENGYIVKKGFSTFHKCGLPIDTELHEIMEEYHQYKMGKNSIHVEGTTPRAREQAGRCQNCKEEFNGFNGDPLLDESVTLCSKCGTKTPFKHE